MPESLDSIVGADVPREEGNKPGLGTDATLEKALEQLFTKRDMALKSDISQRQVMALARGLIFAKRYKSSSMRSLIDNILELSVSKKREGRRELVRIMQSATQDDDKVEQLKSRLLK